MGHRELVTEAADALKEHAERKKALLDERNEAIKAASADEVPDMALARWTGLSPAQVRRITHETK
jgi:predicted mannosyl-3-phosphoglycerate phosphatase (HAD superfamily)